MKEVWVFGLALASNAVTELNMSEWKELRHWCDFRDVASVQRGEPLILRDAFKDPSQWTAARLLDPEGNGEQIVKLDFVDAGCQFVPLRRSHCGKSTAAMKFRSAERVLRGDIEPDPTANFTFYLNNQHVSAGEDVLSDLASALPRFLWSMVPHAGVVWASGQRDHTTFLHVDMLDNVYIVLKGSKRFTLYSPWDAEHISCGRGLMENSFWDEAWEADSFDDPMVFPAIPRWMAKCSTFQSEASRLEVTLNPGDVLWLPRGWFHSVLSLPGTLAVSLLSSNLWPFGAFAMKLFSSTLNSQPENEESDVADGLRLRRLQSAYPSLEATTPSDDMGMREEIASHAPLRSVFASLAQMAQQFANSSNDMISMWRWPGAAFWASELAGSEFGPMLDLLLAAPKPSQQSMLEGLAGSPPKESVNGGRVTKWLKVALAKVSSQTASHKALADGRTQSFLEHWKAIFPDCLRRSCNLILRHAFVAIARASCCAGVQRRSDGHRAAEL